MRDSLFLINRNQGFGYNDSKADNSKVLFVGHPNEIGPVFIQKSTEKQTKGAGKSCLSGQGLEFFSRSLY